MAKWQKGQSGNPRGKRRGTTNRVTKAVKDALLEALNDGAGAVAFFKRLKNSKAAEDRRTFANLCGRMIPSELVGANNTPLFPEEPNMFEIARRVAFVLDMGARELDRRELDEPEGKGSRPSQDS